MAKEPRDAVLDAAKLLFASKGFAKTTMKGVAATAGVAPDVVKRYYKDKDRLFAAAMRLPFDPSTAVPELIAPGLDGMGERLVRVTFDLLSDPDVRADLVILAKTGASTARLTKWLQDYMEKAVVDRVAKAFGVPDARLRGSLITSYILGVAMSRYILKLEPLASMREDKLIKLVAPVIQDLIDPSKPLPT